MLFNPQIPNNLKYVIFKMYIQTIDTHISTVIENKVGQMFLFYFIWGWSA